METNEAGVARFWFVQDADLAVTPSVLYHEHSKIGEFRVRFGQPDPKRTKGMVSLLRSVAGKQKKYDYRPAYALPAADWSALDAPLGHLLQARRTRRRLRPGFLDREALSTLLIQGAGISGELVYEDGTVLPLRTYPSGGALYPLEIYPLLLSVQGLPAGLYHFDVFGPSLSLLSEGDYREAAKTGCLDDPMLDNAAALLIITAVFPRNRFKYGERSYRFTFMEAGHLAQNIILVGQALGLSVVPLGGFLDRRMESMLGVDGVEESVIYPLVVGFPEQA